MDAKAPFARCWECPLVHQPFVLGDGPTQTDFIVVGQAPGDKEVELGEPFVGPAGRKLRGVFAELGVRDSKVHFTNTVLCHPGKNKRTNRDRKPSGPAIKACHERLELEIKGTGATWVLAAGTVAAAALTGKGSPLSEWRCSVLRRPLRPDRIDSDACSGITHHPSAPQPRALLVADIRTLLGFRCGGRAPDVY